MMKRVCFTLQVLIALAFSINEGSEAFTVGNSENVVLTQRIESSLYATKIPAGKESKDYFNSNNVLTEKKDFAKGFTQFLKSALLVTALSLSPAIVGGNDAFAASDASGGGTSAGNGKILTGGASTTQSGRTIAITRGVNLDRSDFSNQNMKGVAFQQSIVRDSTFKNSNLVSASFFDATVDGTIFDNADMTLANVEMAQFNRASMKDTVAREMYVSGATLFEGIKSIEGSDWTDTYLRADQKKYLCNHPTAKGTNPTTGVETRESLMCPN